jgi:hypothetical protein
MMQRSSGLTSISGGVTKESTRLQRPEVADSRDGLSDPGAFKRQEYPKTRQSVIYCGPLGKSRIRPEADLLFEVIPL